MWTALVLYLLFILTFQIPAVQKYLGQRAAQVIGQQLNTQVDISSLQFSIPNHITLSDVLVKDRENQDMLKAHRLSAKVDLLPLIEGRISISTAQVFGAHVALYCKDSISRPNYQFVIDALASEDTTSTSPIDLRINSLIMRNSSVSYDRHDKPETPGMLNPKHLNVYDINAHIILKRLTKDMLNTTIKRLSFKEKSGLQVDRLTMKFDGGPRHSRLQDFILRLPNTNVELGELTASYLLRENELVVPSLSYNGSIKESSITFSDLACFLPSLKTFESTVKIQADIEGRGDDVTLQNLLVTSTTGDVDIDIDGWVRHLSDKESQWQANINHLTLSAKTIDFVSKNMEGRKAKVPAVINRLGKIDLKGIVKGEGPRTFDARCSLNADIGQVSVNMNMNKQRAFIASIETDGINLGRILDNKQLGMLATHIDLEGRIPDDEDAVVNAKGVVNRMDYNGYTYHTIRVNGSYSPTFTTGLLSIDDPNVKLNVEGTIEKSKRTNIVNIKAGVSNLSPKAINITDQWGDALFDATLNANFTASSLNDAIGTIDITDFNMATAEKNYQVKSLQLKTGYDDDTHYLNLLSDFAQINIKGNFEYETLMHSFTNFLAASLPTLPGLPKINPNTNNNFSVNAIITRSDWIENLLNMPLELRQPLMLAGTVNDQMRSITLECDIPSFAYKGNSYKEGHVSISSPNDTLRYSLQLSRLSDEGRATSLRAFGKAANNNLHASLAWDNHAEGARMSGQLNAVANFTTSFNNKQTANIKIEPSVINVHNSNWQIEPAYITYSDKYLDIKGLAIHNDQQHLTINGTASESDTDSISVDLKDIGVEYILQLVDFDAVDFNGYASGKGSIKGLFAGELQANALLTVNRFEFQHGRMGTLHASVDWNNEEKHIDIHAISDDGKDAMTYIDGYVSPDPGFIDLGIRAEGTHLDFAYSFTKSFISHIDGHGNGSVRLFGPLDAINLTGQLVLNGSAHVKTLGCTYEMRNDTLKIVPDEIEFANCSIYDIYGNEGIMTGGIHHHNLTKLTYDIYVDTQKLLAYDFPDFGDELFYGTVYARGHAAIHGRENEVVIDADITPQPRSVFVYNASAPDAITNQEFIQWNTSGDNNTAASGHQIESEFRSDLVLNIKVNATPDATLRLLMDQRTDDYITLQGNGELQTSYYNKGGFNMFGTYRVDNGKYNITIQDIIRKDFTFSEGGTIVFGGDPYEAQIDMQAQYIVSGVSLSDLNMGRSFGNTVRVKCLMNITGQPKAPIVDFDMDILNVNSDEKQMLRSLINSQEEMRQQVVYLLAVGRFYPQGANNAQSNEDDSGRSRTSLAMQSLLSGTLSGQLNSMLSQVIKSNHWNFGANISTGDEGWNNAEYEGIINGRLLNNRLLINGQFGYRDNARTASPSFIGDFDIRYMLFPNGNLALKVYNQTNDRYFTKSSLNTQGIGLIMKKDFNGWYDLFHGKKKKKKEKKKDKD